MRKSFTFLSAAALGLILTSCHKNNDTPNPNGDSQIKGDYQFLYINADSKLTEVLNIPGMDVKYITTSSYKTEKDSGTVTITADSLIGKGVGYSINADATITEYDNGVASGTQTESLKRTIPATNSSVKYTLVGTDSLYCPGGVLGSGSLTSGTQILPPTGARFVLKGDTLTFTLKINQTYPETVPLLNVPAMATAEINATIVMVKK